MMTLKIVPTDIWTLTSFSEGVKASSRRLLCATNEAAAQFDSPLRDASSRREIFSVLQREHPPP